MGLFNNETEGKAEVGSLVVPQSLAEPTGRSAGRASLAHHGAHPSTTGARAYLDQGSKINGKLDFESPAHIEGHVEGEISAKASLIIGESAVVTAQVRASSVVVAGKLSGEIIASERIEVRPSARVSGNLTTPKLVVHEGAFFEGNCTMQPESIREERKHTVFRKGEHTLVQVTGQSRP